jgi:hypothetical protein
MHGQVKEAVMATLRVVVFGVLTVLMATTADAQKPDTGQAERAATFKGQSVTGAPWLGAQYPTPLFTIGNLPVRIWTRVPPAYDVAANRNAAANPLP